VILTLWASLGMGRCKLNWEATFREFNEQSTRQTGRMLRLTKVMAWLTSVMTLAAFGQIWLALKQLGWL
jgi:hypothetical protein